MNSVEENTPLPSDTQSNSRDSQNRDSVSKNKQMAEWQFDNLPNRLTMLRVALVPVIIVLLYLASDRSFLKESRMLMGYIAAGIFIVASITDFFDGYIARKRGIITVIGSFLDPIADKFLVVSSLILLQALHRIPSLLVVILVLRELYITSLRLLAREKGLKVPVDSFGKWKTTFQMIAIPALMMHDDRWIPTTLIGTISIWLAALLSLFSSIRYTIGLLKKLKQKRDRKMEQLRKGETEVQTESQNENQNEGQSEEDKQHE